MQVAALGLRPSSLFSQSCCHNERHFSEAHGGSFTVYTGSGPSYISFIHACTCIQAYTVSTSATEDNVTCRLWQLLKHTERRAAADWQHMCYAVRLWVQLVRRVARQIPSKATHNAPRKYHVRPRQRLSEQTQKTVWKKAAERPN